MSIHLATTSHLPEIAELLRTGRYIHRSIADEDLTHLIERGVAVLAEDAGRCWGLAGVTVEERPETLPPHAPTRARLQAVALARNRWPSDYAPELIAALCAWLEKSSTAPLQVSVHGAESWLERPLLKGGFTHFDRVVVLRLARLQQLSIRALETRTPAALRCASFGDMRFLAALDAETFDPIWHFPAGDMVEMFMRGRMQVAVVDGALAGYAVLLANSRVEAHLARLAVHPRYQRVGIGRQLLNDAIVYAQREGYTDLLLNTQATNLPSLSLYRSAGFRPTGNEVSVLVRTVERMHAG